jgi:hypothetical protein
MWVVAMAAKPGFDTFYPAGCVLRTPIGIWIWSGLFHGFTVSERSLLRAMIQADRKQGVTVALAYFARRSRQLPPCERCMPPRSRNTLRSDAGRSISASLSAVAVSSKIRALACEGEIFVGLSIEHPDYFQGRRQRVQVSGVGQPGEALDFSFCGFTCVGERGNQAPLDPRQFSFSSRHCRSFDDSGGVVSL